MKRLWTNDHIRIKVVIPEGCKLEFSSDYKVTTFDTEARELYHKQASYKCKPVVDFFTQNVTWVEDDCLCYEGSRNGFWSPYKDVNSDTNVHWHLFSMVISSHSEIKQVLGDELNAFHCYASEEREYFVAILLDPKLRHILDEIVVEYSSTDKEWLPYLVTLEDYLGFHDVWLEDKRIIEHIQYWFEWVTKEVKFYIRPEYIGADAPVGIYPDPKSEHKLFMRDILDINACVRVAHLINLKTPPLGIWL